MSPNPVSRWLEPWQGSMKCLMVNKPYSDESVRIYLFYNFTMVLYVSVSSMNTMRSRLEVIAKQQG